MVQGQNNGQREILLKVYEKKSDLKVLCLHVCMLTYVYGFPLKAPVLMWCLVYPLMLWGKRAPPLKAASKDTSLSSLDSVAPIYNNAAL